MIAPMHMPAEVRCERLLAEPDRLKRVVEILAASDPARNFANHAALEKAAAFITSEFRDAGLKPVDQEVPVDGKIYRNVRAHLGPTEGERLIIGAHYDVADESPDADGSVSSLAVEMPGADDNASGVAGLLEIARLLKPVAHTLKRPVELVAFTLEEPPNFGHDTMGSAVHARSLKAENVAVKLMIAIDMIGYFRDEAKSQLYPIGLLEWLYPGEGNFIGLVGRVREAWVLQKLKRIVRAHTKLPTRTLAAPALVPGVSLSDHRNYWSQGMPAIMVTDTAFMRNPHYHEPTDRPDTLDYERMAEVVNGLVGIAREL